MIKIIKLIHTIIWLIMALASFYILYAGLTNTFGWLLFASIGLLATETLVLLFNNWACPLTPLAEKYTPERQANFDIYLPLWIAKYNKIIFGLVFAAGLILVIINWLKN